MLGLVLDIYVVYIVRALLRIWRRRRSSAWEATEARVASISDDPKGWGCTVVEVIYVYKSDGEIYAGNETIPFIWDSSAKDYTRTYPQGSTLAILVKPGDPKVSIISNWN
jgi:hypothetical protein